MDILIYTDGASRGNPGESASGYVIYDIDGNLLHEETVYNGINTNNYAEYNAIIRALKWCMNNIVGRDTNIRLFSDSQLAIRQINGKYRVRSEILKGMYKEVISLSKSFASVSFSNLPREDRIIAYVDRKLNLLLDRFEDRKKFK